MVIGLYIPSMCEKASASAIFCGASLWTHSAFPYLLWLYVRPRVNRAQLYHEEDRRWSGFIRDGKVECNQCAHLQTTLYRNLSLDSRVIAEICSEVHRNYSKTILCLLFLDEVVGSPHLEISWRMETSKFCFTNEPSVAGNFCSFGTGSRL
jgi:hypothetical protein